MSNDLCSALQCNICLMFSTQQLNDPRYVPGKKTFPNLLSCSGCHLVKYCSIQHQKLDWSVHRELCQAVQKIKQILNVSHPLQITSIPQNRSEVEIAILQLKYYLREILGRDLEYQEEALSSFPAFCGQCFKFKNLKDGCIKCNSQLYCSELHRELHKKEHDKVCELLKIYYCPYKVQPIKEDVHMEFTTQVNNLLHMNLEECAKKVFSINMPLNPCQSIKSYNIFSWVADFSCIMTICYAMELLHFQELCSERFIIFILGATVEAMLWFREVHCKFFFLQHPQISNLILNFIGPEVVELSNNELLFTFLGSQRSVKFNTYKGVFQGYCKRFKIRPYLIVVFNCGFSEYSQCYNLLPSITNRNTLEPLETACKNEESKDTWFNGFGEILDIFDTPIVFTSFTEQESQFDFASLKNAAMKQKPNVHITHIIKTSENPYHDLRPLRQWYTLDREEFYYRNGYIQAIRTKLAK